MTNQEIKQASDPMKKKASDRRGLGLSVEQKLELSQMMRQEQDYNRLQMDQRESYIYGVSHKRRRAARAERFLEPGMLQAAEEEEMREEAWQKEQRKNRISFMLRSFAAVILLVIVILMQFENLSIGGVDYQNLIDSLQSEEFINGIDFEELIPYTEEEQKKEGQEKN